MGLINSVLWIVFFDKFFSISQLNSHLYIFFHLTSFKKLPHIRLSGSTYIRLSRQGIFQLFTWPSSRVKRIEFTLLFLALVHQWKQVHMWKFCNAIFESCVTKTEFPFRRLLFLFWGCVTLFCISLSFQWYMYYYDNWKSFEIRSLKAIFPACHFSPPFLDNCNNVL